MSVENNLILVTNYTAITDVLKPRLVLLREVDDIFVTNYSDAIEKINEIIPETIIIYCSNEKKESLNLIKEIRSHEKIKNISILIILDEYNQDFVLTAYDHNITDFITINADDAELLMRTIWCLKKNAITTTLYKQTNLFEELDVISKTTGFYTDKYCNKIFENELRNLRRLKSNGILMLISPSEESKPKLNPIQLAMAIKDSTRTSDVIVHAGTHKFYILLADTQLKGAFCVWEKIKRNVGGQYSLISGISTIDNKPFEKIQKELSHALIEAASSNQDLVIVSEEEKNSSADWLDKITSSQKNFKLFKQAFNKKLDTVITPVFFQMQKLYEEKLFETAIEQYSNSTLSSFILKTEGKISELKITYPGFSKINIDYIHEGLDSPENKRLSLDLTELSEAKLTEILEEFIQEFKINEK